MDGFCYNFDGIALCGTSNLGMWTPSCATPKVVVQKALIGISTLAKYCHGIEMRRLSEATTILLGQQFDKHENQKELRPNWGMDFRCDRPTILAGLYPSQ